MPQTIANRIRPVGIAALALLLAGLLLAACGSSSSSSSTTTASASASASTGSTTGPGSRGFAGRFTAVRECLAKDGITLPARKAGQNNGGPAGAGGLLGGSTGGSAGGPKLPAGVTRAKFDEAIKKCGGSGQFGGGFKRRGSLLQNASYRAALTKFASCMKENGVNVPAPNTSGSGPIFSTKGLNTSSASFRSAETKCYPILRSATAPPAGGSPGSSTG
jgi:hypothetical protein